MGDSFVIDQDGCILTQHSKSKKKMIGLKISDAFVDRYFHIVGLEELIMEVVKDKTKVEEIMKLIENYS